MENGFQLHMILFSFLIILHSATFCIRPGNKRQVLRVLLQPFVIGSDLRNVLQVLVRLNVSLHCLNVVFINQRRRQHRCEKDISVLIGPFTLILRLSTAHRKWNQSRK